MAGTMAPELVVYAVGSGSSGQLLSQDFADRDRVVRVCRGVDVAAVATGGSHTLVLGVDGRVHACGSSGDGQLGVSAEAIAVPDGAPASTPPCSLPQVQLSALRGAGIVSVAAGWSHSLAVCSDGRVWGWGSNAFGQLACPQAGPKVLHAVPIATLAAEAIASVAAGVRHTLFLTRDGRVLAAGCNKHAQLGVSTSVTARTATPIALTLPAGCVVAAVAAGMRFSAALTRDGRVFTWGDNKHAQLGRSGAAEPAPVALPEAMRCIAAGWSHVVGVTVAGHPVAWGRNDYGQCGSDTACDAVTVPTRLPALPAQSGTPVAAACGAEHSILRTDSGQVWVFGWNEHGQLGLGGESNAHSASPVPGIAGCTDIAAGGGASFFLCDDKLS